MYVRVRVRVPGAWRDATIVRLRSFVAGFFLSFVVGAAGSSTLPNSNAIEFPVDHYFSGVGAEVIVPDAALPPDTDVRIERLSDGELPPLPPGLINVTGGGGGYRFLPAGTHFPEPVKVVIPLEESAIVDGRANTAVHTYFWDEKEKAWRGLQRISTDSEKKRLVSETTHFTTMINAVLAPPEHPPPLSFNPNSIKDLAAADATAEIDLLEPPVANHRGTAELSYPIRLSAERGAYSPLLTLTYSSASGNGWVGLGWSLNVPQISVDTRWGVPRYDGVSERYLLNGQTIVPIEEQPNAAWVSGEGATLVAQYAPRRVVNLLPEGSGARARHTSG